MVLRLLRVGFAVLAVAAIATQLLHTIDDGRSVVSFLSFFTIDSNVLGAASLLALGASPALAASRRFTLLRGTATVALATTGVVFALLLRDVDVNLTLPWVNTVVHQVMPIVIVVDWIVAPPPMRLRWRDAAAWLAFPIVWTVYTMVRGAIVGWYPYPFLDPGVHGALGVAGYVVAIAVFVALVAAVMRWIAGARAGAATLPARG